MQPEDRAPWDSYTSLTPEHLYGVLGRYVDLRADVVSLLDADVDGAYGIGCVHYRRWQHLLRELERDGIVEVLDAMRCVFIVGGVPFRIFRAGETDRVPSRVLHRTGPERERLDQLEFGFGPPAHIDSEWFWRIRMLTTDEETVAEFILEEMNEQEIIRACHRVDIRDLQTHETHVGTRAPEPVDLPDFQPTVAGGPPPPSSISAAPSAVAAGGEND